MKRYIFTVLSFIIALSMSACSRNSVSNESTLSSSSEEPTSSSYVPVIPSKEEGVTLDAFTEKVNELSSLSQRPFRITYQIVETVVGTYPIYKRNGSELLEEGVYNTTLVIESSDGTQSKTKVIGDRPNTTSTADAFTSGTILDAKGWLSYHKQRRSFLDSAQEGEGFKETFYLDSFRMWMVIWGNRPANSSVEGTYFGYEEFERTHDLNGYCKTIYYRNYQYIDGVFSRWDTKPKEYHGSYDFLVNGTVEYLDQE